MMFTSLIRLLPFAFFVMLTACQSTPRPTTLGNPSVEVVAQVPQDTAKALCKEWLESLPTWADEDTEQTKDEVDRSIRVQEKVCSPYL